MRTRNHFGTLTIVTVAILAACSDPVQSPTAPSTRTPQFSEVDAQAGRDDYIVVLRETESAVSATAASLAASVGGMVKDQWKDVINGFLADMTDEGAAALRRRAEVVLVEKNAPVQASATQLNAPWGLRRIDDRFLPNDANYTYNKTGLGVHAYIIDTGIRPTHVDFTGRVLGGFSVIAGGVIDCNGHGTHVAGTVGGTTYGVAKRVWIHPVRVLNCAGSGTTAGVISGINWVRANRVLPAVANLSLGGGFSAALNLAVNNLVTLGNVATAVAAGNSNLNACGFSPASAASVLTVGATAINDTRAVFSNFGACLDIFAPGVGIRSDWFTSNVATAVLSGTSMASPHVAGVLAQVRQWQPLVSAVVAQNIVITHSTPGIVINAGAGSPNRMLFMGLIP